MNSEELRGIIDSHGKWLRGEAGGVRASLAGADLAGADLAGANLAGADLFGANLEGACLEGANLAGANLAGANLEGADLFGANLARANLEGANLEGANLAGANLEGANLAGANLEGAYLEWAYLDASKSDAMTVVRPLAGGWLRAYGWTALLMRDSSIRLRYGCEDHPLAKWPEIVGALCNKHVADAREYARDLRALFSFVASIGGAA